MSVPQDMLVHMMAMPFPHHETGMLVASCGALGLAASFGAGLSTLLVTMKRMETRHLRLNSGPSGLSELLTLGRNTLMAFGVIIGGIVLDVEALRLADAPSAQDTMALHEVAQECHLLALAAPDGRFDAEERGAIRTRCEGVDRHALLRDDPSLH